MSQHLVFANCIPLVLKFFNQNIMAYIGSKNNIALLDFPSCVIGEQPELTAETLEIGDTLSPFCWRNMFSCINLLRVLNKLNKWKHSRIMVSGKKFCYSVVRKKEAAFYYSLIWL